MAHDNWKVSFLSRSLYNVPVTGAAAAFFGMLAQSVYTNSVYIPVKHLIGPNAVATLAGVGSLNFFMVGASIGVVLTMGSELIGGEKKDWIDNALVIALGALMLAAVGDVLLAC
jgi:hypothetical protein